MGVIGGVFVDVKVNVGVLVLVGVVVDVGDAVTLTVNVLVGVNVGVAVNVGVDVNVGVCVGVDSNKLKLVESVVYPANIHPVSPPLSLVLYQSSYGFANTISASVIVGNHILY